MDHLIDRLLSAFGLQRIADQNQMDLGWENCEEFDPHIDIPGILDYSELPTPEEWKAWEDRQTTPSGSNVIQ